MKNGDARLTEIRIQAANMEMYGNLSLIYDCQVGSELVFH
jgi:hypothetical protein